MLCMLTLILIIRGICVLLFVILGIVLFCGKGSFLIAGYNTASPEERAKYDEKALCRAVRCMMFACAACFGLLMLSDALQCTALQWIGLAALFLVVIGGVIYTNTSRNVKRK